MKSLYTPIQHRASGSLQTEQVRHSSYEPAAVGRTKRTRTSTDDYRSATADQVTEAVVRYLRESEGEHPLGTVHYYLRAALESAYQAALSGSYGVGAVALIVTASRIYEFRAANAMNESLGVFEHAELLAILKARRYQVSRIERRPLPKTSVMPRIEKPHDSYPRKSNEFTRRLSEGLHVFGTLEPCPSCVCSLINVGVRQMVSGAEDPAGGMGFGARFERLPEVWRMLAHARGVQFTLQQGEDDTLLRLCGQIFTATRSELDERHAKGMLGAKGVSAQL